MTKYRELFGERPCDSYFADLLREYISAYLIIDCVNAASSGVVDMKGMKRFRKQPVRLGFVSCAELFGGCAELQIRMLEGDIDISVDESIVLMIGVNGEVYPTELDTFIKTYELTGERFALDLPYPPTVLNKNTGARMSLFEYANTCIGTGEDTVSAMQLKQSVKVFTRWDQESYLRGDPGDWLIRRTEDDLYIVTADVFSRLYVRDYTGEDISSQHGAVPVVKKDVHIHVIFAKKAGTLETREGPVSYEAGDAILTGTENESWRVAKERFNETYVPAQGTKPGHEGKYRPRRYTVRALEIDEPFTVEIAGRNVLRGEPGDWLLQYDQNEYGVVGRNIFKKTYDVASIGGIS